ncbi:hypothetical protein I552_1276 [Mycobacterium xenopi 3993]|nr:hypothetical protein I552_1276 [Mycobacterium xenopi 3993]
MGTAEVLGFAGGVQAHARSLGKRAVADSGGRRRDAGDYPVDVQAGGRVGVVDNQRQRLGAGRHVLPAQRRRHIAPRQEYSTGIWVLSANAVLETLNLPGSAGGGVVVLIAAPEVVGPGLCCGFTLPPPHAGPHKAAAQQRPAPVSWACVYPLSGHGVKTSLLRAHAARSRRRLCR